MPRCQHAFIAAVLAACSASTYAQNVLVQTTTRSVLGDSLGIVVQLINLDTGQAVPGAQRFPGSIALHPTRYTRSSVFGLTTLAPRPAGMIRTGTGRNILTTFRTSPLQTIPNTLLGRKRGWRITSAVILEDPAHARDRIFLLERTEDPRKNLPGRISILLGNFDSGEFKPIATDSWLLHGIPIDACILPGGDSVAVLCQGPSAAGAFLHVRNAVTGEVVHEGIELRQGERQYGSTAVALSLSNDGAHLVVLTAGYEIGQPDGRTASWVHVLSPSSLEEVGPFATLPGSARPEDRPITRGHANSLWIVTQSPGTGFGHAAHLTFASGRPEIDAQIPFTGLRQALRIASDPSGTDVAVGIDNRLELWPNGRADGTSRTFVAPIGAVAWDPRGILLGEGGRFHLLDPATLLSLTTVQLQTGWVTEIHVLPEPDSPDLDGDGLSAEQEAALHTSETSPDTDGDGIADGVDPEPTLPSPTLTLPSSVTLRGEAAGAEILTFTPNDPAERPWRIHYDTRDMRWMKLNTNVLSMEGQRMTIGIDPATYASAEDEWLSGIVTVELRGNRPGSQAAGSPARFVVDVAPSSGSARRILWVWGEEQQDHSPGTPSASRGDYTVLARMLAGPPHHVSHQDVSGPIGESLEAYDLVVIDMEAAIKGVLTRQVALDYVANGGSLLFLGASVPGTTTEAIERWLEPAGIAIEPNVEVTGAFARSVGHDIARNWDTFEIRAGCTILAGEGVIVPVPGDFVAKTAILAQRRFGFGRIAVLAAGTPLQNNSITEQKHARFANDLFDWLLSNRHSVQDQDADGLPDYVEDVNGNGIADTGETDLFDPDSDDDGIPDGMEDRNGNGTVDEGETNPRNADSDDDGIADGADAFPLPPAGRPQITSIDPLSGPAEGGTVVELTGLNFTPNLSVWFGDQRSERVRTIDSMGLIAVSPGDNRPQVNIRVVDDARGIEATFPSKFRYTLRSEVRLGLDSFRLALRQYQIYAGAVAIMLDAPNVQVGKVAFNVAVYPPGTVDQFRVIASPQLSAAQRRIFVKRLGPTAFRITLSEGLPLAGRINLGTIQWNTVSNPTRPHLRFEIRNPLVVVELGGRAYVDTNVLTMQLNRPVSRAAPR